MNIDMTLPVRVKDEVRWVITAEANSRQLKMSDIVREALEEYIGSHNLKVKHAQVLNGPQLER